MTEGPFTVEGNLVEIYIISDRKSGYDTGTGGEYLCMFKLTKDGVSKIYHRWLRREVYENMSNVEVSTFLVTDLKEAYLLDAFLVRDHGEIK